MHPVPRPLIIALALVGIAAILFVFRGQRPVPTGSVPATNAPRPTARTTTRPPDIDTLLPVPRGTLATVVGLADRFTTAYGTYRYDQPTSTYLERLRPEATTQLLGELCRAATTPGLRSDRTQTHEYATTRAKPHAFRAISPDSVIVVLDVTQTTITSSSRQTHQDQLAVTAVATTDGWRINDVQPATAGNAGDVPDAPDAAH